jgi:hypothetical protein
VETVSGRAAGCWRDVSFSPSPTPTCQVRDSTRRSISCVDFVASTIGRRGAARPGWSGASVRTGGGAMADLTGRQPGAARLTRSTGREFGARPESAYTYRGLRPKPSKRDRAAIKRERRTSGCHKTAMVTLIGRPQFDDAEATCTHRMISIKNVAVLPKMPSTAVNHRAAGEIRLRSLQHVVSENWG